MITFKEWFIFLVVANFLGSEAAWGFSFQLSKSSIMVGEPTHLRLTIPHQNKSLRPNLFDDLLTQHKNLKLLERQVIRTDTEYEITFELTAYLPNNYTVPPIQIQLGSDTFSTEALNLNVSSTRTSDDQEIRPEFAELATPVPWKKLFEFFIWTISGLCLLWLARWSVARIPWREFIRLSLSFRLPPLESNRSWLKKQIHRIQSERRGGKDPAALIDDLIYTLKRYIGKKTHLPAVAWTSTELSNQLSDFFSNREKRTIFDLGDSFKYEFKSGKSPGPLLDELLIHVEREFLK